MFDPRGGISCRDEFVRFATIRSSMVIIVLFVNSGSGILTMSMQLIIWMSATRRMRRTVSTTMRDLPRGKRVQGQAQMPSARLRTGRRHIPRRRKQQAQTDRHPSGHRTRTVCRIRQRRDEARCSKEKIRKRRGKWALCWWFYWFCLLCLELIICIVCLCILFGSYRFYLWQDIENQSRR